MSYRNYIFYIFTNWRPSLKKKPVLHSVVKYRKVRMFVQRLLNEPRAVTRYTPREGHENPEK